MTEKFCAVEAEGHLEIRQSTPMVRAGLSRAGGLGPCQAGFECLQGWRLHTVQRTVSPTSQEEKSGFFLVVRVTV